MIFLRRDLDLDKSRLFNESDFKSGVNCKCGTEMIFDNPSEFIAGNPTKRAVSCPTCKKNSYQELYMDDL